MSLAIGTDEDAEIWELSDSHVWEQRVEQQHREGLRDNCGGLFRLRLLFALGVGRVHPHLPDLSHRVLHDGLPARARSRRVESGVEHHRNCPRVERGRQLRADVEAEV